MRKFALFSLILAGSVYASTARSAESEGTQATAMALFDAGRELLAEGKYAEACPKFEAAARLSRSLGTLLNLADCYEKGGRTASAWAAFRDAAAEALRQGRSNEEEEARRRQAALDGRVARLTVLVPEASRVPGLVVKQNGRVLDPAAFDGSLPVDPGMYRLEASAPGKKTWLESVDLSTEGRSLSITVPVLEPSEPASPAVGPKRRVAPLEPSRPAPPSERSGPGTQRVFALALGGFGVLSLGAGTAFGLSAQSQWNDERASCRSVNVCDSSGSRETANLSTIGVTVGIAGLVGATILWLTEPAPAHN